MVLTSGIRAKNRVSRRFSPGVSLSRDGISLEPRNLTAPVFASATGLYFTAASNSLVLNVSGMGPGTLADASNDAGSGSVSASSSIGSSNGIDSNEEEGVVNVNVFSPAS